MVRKRGKGGAGDRLARMSVEQRKAYMDRRAAMEIENVRKREELLAGFLKVLLYY